MGGIVYDEQKCIRRLQSLYTFTERNVRLYCYRHRSALESSTHILTNSPHEVELKPFRINSPLPYQLLQRLQQRLGISPAIERSGISHRKNSVRLIRHRMRNLWMKSVGNHQEFFLWNFRVLPPKIPNDALPGTLDRVGILKHRFFQPPFDPRWQSPSLCCGQKAGPRISKSGDPRNITPPFD